MGKSGGKKLKWNWLGKKHAEGKNMRAVGDERSELQAVYVGKSRRRYLVSSDVVDHPLFRQLVERSRQDQDEDENVNDMTNSISVSCEVVLFQHLLWMLHNAHPQLQPDSLHDLVDFYAS